LDKDIRYTEKKVDESWKAQAAQDKRIFPSASPPGESEPREKNKTSAFLNLMTSLGLQAMMCLGEIPNPETGKKEVNLEGARELIDLLMELQRKTQGNLTPAETNFFQSALPQIQLKFAQTSQTL